MGTVQSREPGAAVDLESAEIRGSVASTGEQQVNAQPGAEPNNEPEVELSVKESRSALMDCVLDSSYKWCTLGIALAVPVGVRTKSYNSLVYFGMSGTLLDFYEGYYNCQTQRQAYEDAQKRDTASEA